MTDFAHARKQMVDNQLRTSAVTDRRVLAAMGEVPREEFIIGSRHGLAYIDEPLPLAGAPGRWLGSPAPFARLLQLAAVDPADHVLDLAAGNGYSSAVLARLAASVVAVESHAGLAGMARDTLGRLGVSNVTIEVGPIESAGAAKGPYDLIVIEGTVPEVPQALFSQLRAGGRLVALIGAGGRPAVAHLFAHSGKGIAARAEFDANLPPIAAPGAGTFVF